ncbi:MAG: RNA polymerase sigma-70 factor (ECF subfamily) [Myxococcota bacterium]|jgi:RNA polymerase sigma-70 factor (ECF subfamily)
MNDDRLITAHLSGDPDALRMLIARHRAPLMGFLTSRVGRDAEDLYQETWDRAIGALSRYEDRGTFRAWLLQIARRLIIDHRRRASARIQLLPTESPPDLPSHTTPYHHTATRQLSEATDSALAALAPEVAAVVRMRLIDHLPFKQIAARERIPLNTALGRMHRGLKQIRQALLRDGLLDAP